MRVWLYAYTASESQNEPGVKVGAQHERLRRYASDQGWEIVGETREAATPGSDKRPGFTYLMEVASSHTKQFDILLVESLSRLSRNMMRLKIVMRRLNVAGIEVYTTEGPQRFPNDRIRTLDELQRRLAEDARVRRLAAARLGRWLDRK
jgi:DNA invertase Pin-like site-specific DNA recombinase